MNDNEKWTVTKSGRHSYSDAFRKQVVAYFCNGHTEKETCEAFKLPVGSCYAMLSSVRTKKFAKGKKAKFKAVSQNGFKHNDIKENILSEISKILDKHINDIIKDKFETLLKGM